MKIIKPESHRQCIVCSESNLNPMSLKMQFIRHENTRVSAEIKLGESYQGYENQLHGGIISTLVDGAMTQCLFAQNIQAMTAELTVRFIRPVPINQTLLVDASILSERRGMQKLVSHIYCNGNELVRANAKFLTVKM